MLFFTKDFSIHPNCRFGTSYRAHTGISGNLDRVSPLGELLLGSGVVFRLADKGDGPVGIASFQDSRPAGHILAVCLASIDEVRLAFRASERRVERVEIDNRLGVFVQSQVGSHAVLLEDRELFLEANDDMVFRGKGGGLRDDILLAEVTGQGDRQPRLGELLGLGRQQAAECPIVEGDQAIGHEKEYNRNEDGVPVGFGLFESEAAKRRRARSGLIGLIMVNQVRHTVEQDLFTAEGENEHQNHVGRNDDDERNEPGYVCGEELVRIPASGQENGDQKPDEHQERQRACEDEMAEVLPAMLVPAV